MELRHALKTAVVTALADRSSSVSSSRSSCWRSQPLGISLSGRQGLPPDDEVLDGDGCRRANQASRVAGSACERPRALRRVARPSRGSLTHPDGRSIFAFVGAHGDELPFVSGERPHASLGGARDASF